jgi:solute carrier family 35 protein F5
MEVATIEAEDFVLKLDKLKVELKEVFKLSAMFCLLWFFSNYFYNYGLAFASVTSSVILSNTSPMWVYIFGLSCLVPAIMRDKFNWIKALMVVISITGFIIIAIQDFKADPSTTETGWQQALGDGLTLISAVFYGLYATFLKVKVPEEKEESFRFTVFLGFVGLINDIILLPLFPIFNWIGLETFAWPNGQTTLLLTVNALIGTVLSDYCWARSVVLLGPLVTTLGITLTFPLSLLVDLIGKHKSFTWLYYVGSAFIFAAFGVISFVDYR